MRGIIILLCALLSLHGCFGGGQGESISITPSSVHLAVGQTQQFTLTRTFYGRSEEDTATEFSNSNSNVATDLEDSAELSVTALAPGLSEQTVFVDGLSATATINVRRHWTTTEIAVPSLVQASANLAVDIPESAASIGIALMGTNSNLKMTDHGIFLVDGFGNPVFIVDPSGSPISLSFKYTDIDLDGINDRASFSMLFAREITSLFFSKQWQRWDIVFGHIYISNCILEFERHRTRGGYAPALRLL